MIHSESRTAADRINTVSCDPADVVEAFKRNRDHERDRRGYVLRLSPPFENDVTAVLHELDADADAPADDDPAPIDLGPEAFVNVHGEYDPTRTRIPAPTREDSRSIARTDHGDDVTAETVDEYHATAMDAWKECVRTSLVDEIPVSLDTDADTDVWATVRYEPDE